LRNIGSGVKIDNMYMQDKLGNARGILYAIALAVLAVLFVWKLIIR
jgi:hypothetical protein